MLSPIEVFPVEIFHNVVAHLDNTSMVRLMSVSKSYHTFLEPILWTKIEMHTKAFHKRQAHRPLREELSSESRNRVCSVPAYESGSNGRIASRRSDRLVKTLSTDEFGIGLSEARVVHLGSLITWLCLNVVCSDVCRPIMNLVNLSYLEINAFWFGEFDMPSISPEKAKGTMSRLRTLKLRGYFEKNLVQYLLRDPSNVEELQLGVLDVPISSSLQVEERRCNLTPPGLHIPDDFDDLPADEQAMYEDADDWYSHECVAPRSLACLTPEIMRRLSSLRKIHLIRPTSSERDDDFMSFSPRSEELILREWADVIRATRHTLEYIVLDHRPVAGPNAPDGSGNCDFLARVVNGESYEMFVETVLPVLLESSEFPALKTIRTFGFEAYDEKRKHTSNPMRLHDEYTENSVDVPGQLQAAFPNVMVTDHVGRRIVMDSDDDGTPSGGEGYDVFDSTYCHDSDSNPESDCGYDSDS